MLTHRAARRKLGSRTTRRSGQKTQALPKQSKPTGKGALAKYRNPKRHPKLPILANRVKQLIAAAAARGGV